MKKTLFARTVSTALALLIFCGALLLTSCHGAVKNAPFEVPDEFDTSREYEISFWAKNDTNVAQYRIYRKAAEDFHALYPNITVNIKSYTDYGVIYNDVITNIPTKTTPDIAISYPDHIATYLTGDNVVVPLDLLFDDEKYGLGGSELRYDGPKKEEIVPQFLSELRFGERYFGLPFMRSTEACYINKTLLEKLGYTVPDKLTWDFVWEVSDAAMAKAEDGTFLLNGQKVLIPFIYKSTDNMMIQMLRQKDAPYSDAAGVIGIFSDETKDILRSIAPHAENRSFSTFKISSYPGNYINAGQCIFAIDSTAGATWIGSRAPMQDIDVKSIVPYELEIRTIPQFDPDDPKMISQGPSVCVFNKDDPQQVLATWLFAQYLLSNDVQIAYSETEGYIPVTLKAQESDEYLDYLSREGEDDVEHYAGKIQCAKMLLANKENTFVTPVYNGSASLRDAAGELIEQTVSQVRKGGAADDAFFDDLFEKVVSLKRLNLNGTAADGKADLGPLPSTSVVLLVSLGVAWLILGSVFAVILIREKRKK